MVAQEKKIAQCIKWAIACLGLFISSSVFTYTSTPPVGYTSAPGEANCSACHSCTPITSGTVWGGITLARTGGSLTSITPNASNPMTLSFTSATSTKFGFQLCVLPNSATGTSASIGTLNAGTSSLVQALSRTGPTRNYISQTSAGSAASSGSANWAFNWVTPLSYSGGATFYVVINETDGNSNSADDQIYLKTFTTTVLPVRWLDFSANSHEDGIHLAWSTAAEINNEKFEVERSLDGEHFEYAGTIKGKGNSVQISNYRFIDPINSNNEWFYRIKQIDFDGKFEYSRTIKSLALQQKEPRIFTVMATQEIAVEAQEAIKSLNVINLQGQVIATLTNNGNNRFQLPYALNGIYIISVQTANQYYTQKMFLGSN
jgi:hypothetical protein